MADSSPPTQIRFDYIKSNHFRMVHADGVIGGPTPKGLLFLSFFNERAAIPQQVVHSIDQTEQSLDPAGRPQLRARVGEEIVTERVSRQAIIRETEIGVILDLATAEKLHDWLEKQIATLKTGNWAK